MEPLDHLTGEMSETSSLTMLLAYSLLYALAACVALAASHAASRRARDAQAAIDGAPSLRVGGALVLGVVETEGDDPAITITLTEDGRQWGGGSGGLHHEWTEVERASSVRSFHLVTDRNERVRVEPPAQVALVDRLRVVERRGTRRVRVAELTEGERASITGRLRRETPSRREAGSYRTAATAGDAGWVLDAAPDGSMVVATESLAEHHRDWARFHRRAAIGPIVLLLVVNALAYLPFYDFVLHGQRVVGTVVRPELSFSYDRNGRHTAYRVLVSLPDQQVSLPVSRGGYLLAREGAPIALMLTPGRRLRLGSEPGIEALPMVLLLIPTLTLAVLVLTARRSRTEWWEQPRVRTRGRGPL